MKVESVWEVCCDTIAGLRHEGAIMISWLKRRLVGWLEGCQQHEIERLHEEGCRLKEEVLRLTGQDRIVLSSEERRLLAEKAKGIDPEVLKRICLFDLEDLDPPSPNAASTESR